MKPLRPEEVYSSEESDRLIAENVAMTIEYVNSMLKLNQSHEELTRTGFTKITIAVQRVIVAGKVKAAYEKAGWTVSSAPSHTPAPIGHYGFVFTFSAAPEPPSPPADAPGYMSGGDGT